MAYTKTVDGRTYTVGKQSSVPAQAGGDAAWLDKQLERQREDRRRQEKIATMEGLSGKPITDAQKSFLQGDGHGAINDYTDQYKKGIETKGRVDALRTTQHEIDKNAYALQQGLPDWAKQQQQAVIGQKYQQQYGDQARTSQLGALGLAEQYATGQQSIAQQQAALQADNATRAAMAQAASARGGYNPATQRQALMAASDARTQIGAQAAVAAAQEKQAALQTYGNMAQGLRGQDIAVEQDVNRWIQGNQELASKYAAMGLNENQVAAAMRQEYERAKAAQDAQLLGIATGQQQAESAANKGLIGQIVGGIAGAASGGLTLAAMKSDERSKTDKKKSPSEIRHFLDALDGYTYRYKGEDKKRMGVMAQDVEQGGIIGQNMVSEIDGVKHLDTQDALTATLASLAEINKRLKHVEKRKGK